MELTPMRSAFSTSSMLTGTSLPNSLGAKKRLSGPAIRWRKRVQGSDMMKPKTSAEWSHHTARCAQRAPASVRPENQPEINNPTGEQCAAIPIGCCQTIRRPSTR